jgi:putative ABC transport system ATP-binding protein
MSASDALVVHPVDPHSGDVPAALELTGVSKIYPGNPPVVALDNVSLRVESGEMIAIVGPSGSGKSTLLNIVGTLDRPTSGGVRIAGHLVSDMSDRRLSAVRANLVGFVFQHFFLMEGENSLDNVADGLLYTGMAMHDRRARAFEALRRVGLSHRMGHRPNQLSGGEKQRVAIARAIVGRPSLVLADEPTGALDSKTSASIIELLGELHDEGSTIVIITHDNDLASRIGRRVVFRDGGIVADEFTDREIATADITRRSPIGGSR